MIGDPLMLRRIGVILLAPALGVLLALGAAPPASAEEPLQNPAAMAGINFATGLAACGSIDRSPFGGWTQRSFTSARAFPTPDPEGDLPVVVYLGEICKWDSNSLGLMIQSFHPIRTDPATEVARVRLNSSADGDGDLATAVVYCRSTSNAIITRNITGIQRSSPVDFATGVAVSVIELYDVPSGCDKIVAVTLTAYTEKVGGGHWKVIQWSADRYAANYEYGNDEPEGADEICADAPEEWLFCDSITAPNPVGYDDTCGDIDNAEFYGVEYAAFNPVDAATWGPATAWLGACLFVPLPEVGGFDREGIVADAWEDSPNSEVGEAMIGAADAFSYAPGCGPVISSSSGSVLPDFQLNTCGWTWAYPVRDILGVGVLIGGFWFFITYTVRAVSGLIRKNVPSPVEVDS